MAERGTERRTLARLLRRVIVYLLAGVAILYAADYLVLRYRVATNRNPYGTVTVQPYYAVPRKDHKIEYMFDDPHDETCVHSIFPHLGDSPCWYLNRNKQKRIDM
jgi:hypothetical protein